MKYVAVLLILVLGIATAVWSQTRLFDVPQATIEVLFPIAAELSGYPLPAERPRVVFASPPLFAKYSDPGFVTYGLYDIDMDEPDVIFLNPDTPTGELSTTLVHEIVHWLQEKAGRHADTCEEAAAVEREAYLIDYHFAKKYLSTAAVLETPEFPCP